MTSPPALPAPGERPRLLIVTMGIDYVAPARMPRELRSAGFDVTLLAARDALATHTRHLDRVAHFPERATLFEWIHALAGVVRAVRPQLLLPGDDVTVGVLAQLALDPPPMLRGMIRTELADLIVRSLGDPARFDTAVDKTRLMPVARAAGVRVPEGGEVDDEDSAVALADSLGYPVIVRPACGSGGAGVARCTDATTVRAAIRALPAATGWAPPSRMRALVQRFVAGKGMNRPALAWAGREIAAFTRTALERHPAELGAGSVTRYVEQPEIAAMNRTLLAALGATGFVSTQYLIEDATGLPYLIESNRRMTPATPTGRWAGVDLAAALAAVAAGRAWDGPADLPAGTGRTLALFPQEWLRDPGSRHLRELPTDVPWDDPGLIRAMLALGRAGRGR